MKTTRVKTWKLRPAMLMLTALVELPLPVEDLAPPMDWRTRERMSQGMKIQ